MSGISEALVATAVGLLVAIPAVVAFNYFSRRIKVRMAEVEWMAQIAAYQVKAAGLMAASRRRRRTCSPINVTPLVDIARAAGGLHGRARR
jgi:hypothetical protein